jgi:branched-chain amino acid transport system permease protein
MIKKLLSGDLPRSRLLSAMLLAVLIGLALAPFLFHGARSLNVAATICVFVVLVASYDLLLGYTGIVSFAHTMFYGIGAYGVGLALHGMGPSWWAIFVGTAGALAVSLVLALIIGLFSLRVRAIFYAVLASQLSVFTGGEDGRTFKVPELLQPSFRLFDAEILGRAIDGKLITYYLVFFSALALFLLMLRIVNSPFGRVLQAIRENDFRAEALGYRTVVYRTLANCLGALIATLAGVLMALWLRYVGPKTMLSFEVMTDILLIVVIGGMGTVYGAVIGSALFILMQNYLQVLMKEASTALVSVPLLSNLFHPDRWLLWLGVLFVLSVYFFPTGIVGRLRTKALLRERR